MVAAIVQARMSSRRLPGKVLMPILGKPMLQHVVERLSRTPSVDVIVIATSNSAADDAIEAFGRTQGFLCFRGSEEDVLDRFYCAAQSVGGDILVRITADCPLTSPRVVERAIRSIRDIQCDYIFSPRPEGLDVEVFTASALTQAWTEAQEAFEREHVTPYIRLSGKFRAMTLEPENDLSFVRNGWSVDSESDLAFVRAVFERVYPTNPNFDLEDVLVLLKHNPELMTINITQNRYSGFYESVARSSEQIEPNSRDLSRSAELKAKAQAIIPAGSQTFSKGPTQFVQGIAPNFIRRGQGCHVWDVDGNEYIDYPMALGAIILGHNYPPVTKAVQNVLADGTCHSLPHPLEIEVSELLCKIIPCAEMVRFGKNGSDATSAAIRAARAITDRSMIACCGYHGWQDWYIGTTTRNKGVPSQVSALTTTFNYNDPASLEELFQKYPDQIAAVILEPVGVVSPHEGFLKTIKELAHSNGALLIFDEIVTGFRVAIGGAQQYFNIEPDLAAFGKAMGNGFPISAVVGKREYMKIFDEIFFSTTFGGETVGLAAAAATIKIFMEHDVVGHLWRQGEKLKSAYNVLARERGMAGLTECIGFPPRTVISFKDESGAESLLLKSLFQQECLKRGILFSGGQNICFSHTDLDVEQTIVVYDTVLRIVRAAIENGNVNGLLEGSCLQPVFRRP